MSLLRFSPSTDILAGLLGHGEGKFLTNRKADGRTYRPVERPRETRIASATAVGSIAALRSIDTTLWSLSSMPHRRIAGRSSNGEGSTEASPAAPR